MFLGRHRDKNPVTRSADMLERALINLDPDDCQTRVVNQNYVVGRGAKIGF